MDRFGGRKFSNCDVSRKIFITRFFVVAFRQASFILFFESASNEPGSQLKEHSIRPHCPGVSPTQFKFNWAWKFPTCCLNSPPRVYHFHRSPPWTTSLTSKTIFPAIPVYHIQNQSQRRQGVCLLLSTFSAFQTRFILLRLSQRPITRYCNQSERNRWATILSSIEIFFDYCIIWLSKILWILAKYF